MKSVKNFFSLLVVMMFAVVFSGGVWGQDAVAEAATGGAVDAVQRTPDPDRQGTEGDRNSVAKEEPAAEEKPAEEAAE